MNININNIILESLSNHFKKHWKKYALGLGLAGLGAGGAYALHGHNELRKANKEAKHLANASALTNAISTGVQNYNFGKFYNHPNIGKLVANNAVSQGLLPGLAVHHIGRKITDKIVDRNAHWWNAGKRARTKRIANHIFAGLNTASELYRLNQDPYR